MEIILLDTCVSNSFRFRLIVARFDDKKETVVSLMSETVNLWNGE